MVGVHKRCLARLISGVAAVALLLAPAMATLGHAAGHVHVSPAHGLHAKVVKSMAALIDVDAGESDGQHRSGDDTGHSHDCCCGSICHGGQAILSAALISAPLPARVSLDWPSNSTASRSLGCLERPPRLLFPA